MFFRALTRHKSTEALWCESRELVNVRIVF